MSAVILLEAFAIQLCKDLVQQGADFTCTKVEDGWLFEVCKEPK